MTKVKKIFFYIMLITLGSCDYKPIYSQKDSFNVPIQSFKVEGDRKLNREIISSLNLKDRAKTKGYKLIINSNKRIIAASKDAAGNISIYKTEVIVNISLIDDDKVFKEKTFSSDFNYNNLDNKFDLSQYQKNIEINLINKIIEEIFTFLTL